MIRTSRRRGGEGNGRGEYGRSRQWRCVEGQPRTQRRHHLWTKLSAIPGRPGEVFFGSGEPGGRCTAMGTHRTLPGMCYTAPALLRRCSMGRGRCYTGPEKCDIMPGDSGESLSFLGSSASFPWSSVERSGSNWNLFGLSCAVIRPSWVSWSCAD